MDARLRPPTSPASHRSGILLSLSLATLVSLVGTGCSVEGRAADARAAGPAERVELATPRRIAAYDWRPFQIVGDVTPDGDRFLVVHNDNGQLGLWDPATHDMSRWLTDPALSWDPWIFEAILSPEGDRAAYHEFNDQVGGSLVVVEIASGTSTTLQPPAGSDYHYPLDWHPGGGHLLVSASRSDRSWLMEYDLETGASTRLVSDASGMEASYTPDGEHVVYGKVTGPHGEGAETWLLRRDLTGEAPFDGIPPGAEVVDFSPDGAWVLYEEFGQGAPRLYRKEFDGVRATGVPVLVQGDRWRMSDVGLDRRGRFYYSINTSAGAIWTVALDDDGRMASPPARLQASLHAQRPSYSPDGSSLAYFRNVEGIGAASRRLVIGAADGGSVVEPTFDVPVNYLAWVRWAPDGESLVLKVFDDLSRYAFYRYDLASAAVDTLRVWNGREVVGMLDVTPDGRGVVFAILPRESADDDVQWELQYLDLETLEERTLVRAEGRINMPDVRPAGDSVAFVVGGAVALAPLSGGSHRVVLRHPDITFRTTPVWDAAGRSLYFRLDPDGTEGMGVRGTVMRLDTRTGELHETGFSRDDIHIQTVQMSPDGRTLAVQGESLGQEEIWVLEGVFPGGVEEGVPGGMGR